MAILSRETLKSRFKTGMMPRASDFENWMESYWHDTENIPITSIENLVEILNSKTDKVVTEYNRSLKRIVTAVNTYEELTLYSKADLVSGDGIIVGQDETRRGNSSLYIFQSAGGSWKYQISWIGDCMSKDACFVNEPLSPEYLDSLYGDENIGFEIWCDDALVKYTKISEEVDKNEQQVNVWHRFDYKKMAPVAEMPIASVTNIGVSGRFLSIGGNKLYAWGSDLCVFNGTDWQQLVKADNLPGDAGCIHFFDNAVYFGNKHKLCKYELLSDTVTDVVCRNIPEAMSQDWRSICNNGTNLFVGAGGDCELGVQMLNARTTELLPTNLDRFSERDLPESYWVVEGGGIIWAGSVHLPDNHGNVNSGLWYFDKAQNKFVATNLTFGNYKSVVRFGDDYYAFGESNEGIFKASADGLNFVKIRDSGSFNKAIVIHGIIYACGKDGLYTIHSDNDIRKLSNTEVNTVIEYQEKIFICRNDGISCLDVYTNEIKPIVEMPGAVCEDAVVYNDKLYVATLYSSIKVIEMNNC